MKSKRKINKNTWEQHMEDNKPWFTSFTDPLCRWDFIMIEEVLQYKYKYAIRIDVKYFILSAKKDDNPIQELINSYCMNARWDDAPEHPDEDELIEVAMEQSGYESFLSEFKKVYKKSKAQFKIIRGNEAYAEYCRIKNIPPDKKLYLLKKWYLNTVKRKNEEWKISEQYDSEISNDVVEETVIMNEENRISQNLASQCTMSQKVIYNAYLKFLKDKKEKLKNEKQTLNDKTHQKTFPEYLLHTEKIKLADDLKEKFNAGKGKTYYLMLKALEEKKIFAFVNGEKAEVYESMKIFFNRAIGSRPSIFNFNYEPRKHEADYKATLEKVDFILSALVKH